MNFPFCTATLCFNLHVDLSNEFCLCKYCELTMRSKGIFESVRGPAQWYWRCLMSERLCNAARVVGLWKQPVQRPCAHPSATAAGMPCRMGEQTITLIVTLSPALIFCLKNAEYVEADT